MAFEKAFDGIGTNAKPRIISCAERRHWSNKRRALLISSLAGLLAEILSLPAYAQKLPTNPNVTSGNVSFSQPNTGTLNINQGTNQAVINWQSFSVGRGGTVNFNQPGTTSSTLNRVTGNTQSWIAGTINAPGTVLLVNPNGITITKSGVINTGSFLASTLGISDQDYLNGKYNFTGNGSSPRVVNNGHINVSDGGFAALLGGQVANNGVIVARLGKVGLGSGEEATIDLSGDGFLSVAVPTSELGNLRDEQGKPLVSNKGKILADGGSVYLSAATAANILRDAINVPGTIRANSVGGHDGAIYLGGGAGGTVTVSGHLSANGGRHGKGGTIQIAAAKVKLKATSKITANGTSGGTISVIAADKLVASGKISAKGKSGSGGEVDLTAAHVALTGATIDASGATAGGNVNIGGGPHASVALADAQSVTIDSTSIIRADATDSGDGGHIVVWSDQTTDAGGLFSAKGGPNGGNGGYIEISSQIDLTMRGFADLSAPHGTIGTLLFDPGSIDIVSGGNNYTNADTFNDTYLNAQLASANIVIDTNNATGANGTAGDITLESGASLSWNAATTLTLNAARDIVFQSGSSIKAHGGANVVLNAGDNASGIGTVRFNGTGNQVIVNGGGSVTAYYNPAAFGAADFNTGSVSVTGGGALTAYMLVNNNGQLRAINNNLSGNYALATDLNFGLLGLNSISPTCSQCFEPLGTFNGKLDGRGHTITFTTYSHSAFDQGLFQIIGSSGVVNNLNVNMWGYAGNIIGGIAGDNQGLIENSHATTSVFLIGDPNNALATGSLPTSVVGGLVGINEANGTILNSSASVNTQAGVTDGGLVGVNRGTIANSSASGSVANGTTSNNQLTDIGGLVGLNVGTITGSFASTNVNDYGNVNSNDGGFVGENNGTISSSFSMGSVTGGFFAGGFVGQNDVNAHITASFSTGRATAILGEDSAGFVGNNEGIIAQSYSTGSAGSNRDGTTAFGFASGNSGTLSNDYWDTTTSGLLTGVGTTVTGASSQVTAVQSSNANGSNYAYNASTYSSGFIGTAWYINDGFTRPLPIGLATNTITTSNALLAAIQLELVGSAPNGNYALGTNIDLSVTGASTLWSPRGFAPIGYDAAHDDPFTGTFKGNGYTISNLNIAASGSNVIGLFSQNSGTIENLGLVSGTVSGEQAVGAIAGSNFAGGTITDSYAMLTVIGGNNVGGLAGVNLGTISNSYSIGTVTGGQNGSNGPAGGIVGTNEGTITDTYAASTVTNSNGQPLGGLVGYNVDNNGQTSITQSYWNTDLTAAGVGKSDPHTTNSTAGMNTAQMQDLNSFQSNFAGFNFQTTWAPPNQAGQGGNATAYYPQLYADSHVIWIDPNSATTSYGTQATLTDQTYGLRNYDLPSVEHITLSSTGGNSPNASSTPYAITASGSATSTDGSSYRFITTGGTLTVNPLDLTGTAAITNINKTYDGTTAASGGTVTLTAANGVINGDTVTVSVSSGLYANANVIGIEGVTLNGVSISSGNYVIGNLQLTGTGSISPEQLTVMANSGQSKTYGTNDPTLAYTITTGMLYNGAQLSGALTRDQYGTLLGEQVGSYAILQGTLGAPSANYSIAFTPGTTFAITRATLTVAANGQTKTYGNNDPTLTYTAAGFVNKTVDGVLLSDNVSVLTGALTRDQLGTLGGEQVGTYGITQGTLAASNYGINFTGASLTINKANVTVTADSGQSKTYGTNDPTLTYTQTGLVQNKIVDGVTLNDALTGALSRDQYGTFGGEQVGNYNITQGTLAASSNYTLAFTPGTTFAINKANLTVTADSGQSKTYGTNDPTLTYTQTGLVQNKTVDGVLLNDALTGALSRDQYGTLPGEQVGTYGITQSTLAASSNYSLTLTPGTTFAINKASLTVTADSGQSKTYGTNDPTLTYAQTGLVQGVMVDGVLLNDALTGALSRDQYGTLPGEQVGTYGITQSTLAASSNYSLTLTQGTTFAINKASLTVTADSGQSKTYGTNDPTLTYAQTGLVQGVMVDGVLLNDALTGALSRDQYGTLPGEQVGTYGITQGTLAASSNYSLSFTQGTTFAINKASLTVTADSGQSKTYGTNDPTLTYAQTGLVQNKTVDGVLLNDGLTGAVTRDQYGTLGGEQVDTYGITQGTLAASSNYSLSFTPGTTFAITPATLTVAADAQTKIYATSDPTLTYSAAGFVNRIVDGVQLTDTNAILTGALTRDQYGTLAGENVGTYGITQGTLAASSNYNIAYAGANLTVTPAALTISAKSGQSKTYGDSDPTFGYTSKGLVSTTVDGVALNDSNALSGALGRNAGENVGSYAYTLGSLSAGANYTLAFAPSQPLFGITPATLTYVANPESIAFGNPVPALSGSVTGFKFSDTLASAITGSLTFSTSATSTSPVGVYGILGSGLSANNGNYVFVEAESNDTAFAVTPAPARQSTSQVVGTTPSSQNNPTNFSFQAPNTGPVTVSFTPTVTTPVRTANNNGNGNGNDRGNSVANNNQADTTPTGALDLSFVPISQFDPTQYAGGTLPDYKFQAGQSTVFTMIARALKAAGKQPINDFWNVSTHNPSWPGSDKQIVKVSFSNGAGKTVAPTDANAFPIVPGTTDIPGLLTHGPVLIGSGSAPTVAWLLAFKVTGDGKGILANDPQTGKTLVLSYDPQTKTVGGVTGVFDLKHGGAVVPLAPTPAVLGDYAPGGAYPALQAFKPADFLAVSLNAGS